MLSRRRMIAASASGVLAFGGVVPRALAQATDKLVRMIVGFPASGLTDILARFLGPSLSARLGQQFIVEDRPGAGTNLATEAVARALPDGYALCLGTGILNGVAGFLCRGVRRGGLRPLR